MATATVRELCRLAATCYGLRELRAATAEGNVASLKVLVNAEFVRSDRPARGHLGGKPGTWYQRDLAAGAAHALGHPLRGES